jgi:outer membrane lipoprotein SlyB
MPEIKSRRLFRPRTSASLLTILPLACLLAACGPNYSPDTYSSNAVQQASKVDAGVITGVRKVAISADATVGAATGAAAGGIAGSQAASGAVSAMGALGGAVAGGIAGNGLGHSIDDTFGYEYIVRKPNGDLLSVTQKDEKPLSIGTLVLIIQGPQARIVSDYTVPVAADAKAAKSTPVKPASDVKAPAPANATPQAGAQPSSDSPAASAPTPQNGAGTSTADTASTTHGPGTAH